MRRAAACALILASCTQGAPVAGPIPSPSPAPSPTPSPGRSAVPVFSTTRALETMRALAAIGPREATSDAFRRGARRVADMLSAYGYDVRLQRVPVPNGLVDGRAVPAGTTTNVIAEPRRFDRTAPYVVVGGHLDTVPDSPGANDNASGIGALVELARLASLSPPRVPAVFVAFGAEERRRQSASCSVYAEGARAFVRDISDRDELLGMINIDMIGNGDRVQIVGRTGSITRALVRAAERLRVPFVRRTSISNGFSDHIRFAEAGYPVGWLWAGDHPSLHTPQDTASVVERAEVRRVGRLAWEALRALRAG